MSELIELSATELSRRMAAGQVTAVQAMTACLDRIAAVNPAVNAVISLRPRDELIAEAAAADAAPRKGWLHGIPMAIKDLAAVKGLRTTWGSPIFADFVPQADDLMVARLRAAGAIFIGKTNTPEWGLGSHSFNPVFGATANPYSTRHAAGGSSGGAAAALAARMVWVADGSDMMGSLRNPAAWCNVYGFRPSWGLVPPDDIGDNFMATLATLGPMGRTVEDIAHLLEIQAGENPAVPFGRAGEPYSRMLDQPSEGVRIGWLGDWGGAYPCESGIVDLCESALGQMHEMGCEVVTLAPPYPAEKLWQSWMTLRAFLNAGAKRALYEDPKKRAQLKPEAVWEIEQGLALDAKAVYEASEIRSRWYARLAQVFAQVEVIAMPSAQVWPFDIDLRHPAAVNGRALDTYHRWMEVVVPVSLAGLPALSVPVGFGDSGFPMGMQLAGPVGSDAKVLALGHAWDRLTRWPDRAPPL